VFTEGSKEIGGVLHPEKEENVVVHEEVEGEKPLTFSRDAPLNETRIEVCKVNPLQVLHRKRNLLFQMITHLVNLHKMCRGKDLKGNEGNGLESGGLLPRRWSAPWFEVPLKKLWWLVPPLWWPPTNHEATPYVVFGAFLFIHLVVIHSNLHFVM
jgi:hypothetical protein